MNRWCLNESSLGFSRPSSNNNNNNKQQDVVRRRRRPRRRTGRGQPRKPPNNNNNVCISLAVVTISHHYKSVVATACLDRKSGLLGGGVPSILVLCIIVSLERTSALTGTGHVNDPSAGSPTETLLRLLLPLNDPARTPFRRPEEQEAHSSLPSYGRGRENGHYSKGASPVPSLDHSIGSSDGRCVQRAGTKSVQSGELRLLGIPRSWDTFASPNPL